MSSATETSVEFGVDQFVANAKLYRTTKTKRIVDAASAYDNVEDAIADLRACWEVLEDQSENGAGYTPDQGLGFGSDNAAVIADKLLGRSNSIGNTRKAFAKVGQ
jgi:hypothetical protein